MELSAAYIPLKPYEAPLTINICPAHLFRIFPMFQLPHTFVDIMDNSMEAWAGEKLEGKPSVEG